MRLRAQAYFVPLSIFLHVVFCNFIQRHVDKVQISSRPVLLKDVLPPAWFVFIAQVKRFPLHRFEEDRDEGLGTVKGRRSFIQMVDLLCRKVVFCNRFGQGLLDYLFGDIRNACGFRTKHDVWS